MLPSRFQAYALAVEHLGGDELRQLTETFTMLDKDGDGTVEAAREGLREYLQHAFEALARGHEDPLA